jgi:hypothetical protein
VLAPNREADDNRWEAVTNAALTVLSTLCSMNAVDPWLAAVVVGVGAAGALRVLLRHVLKGRQPSQGQAPKADPADRVDLAVGESSSAERVDASPGAAADDAPPPSAVDRTISWVLHAYQSDKDSRRHLPAVDPVVELPRVAPQASPSADGMRDENA